MNIYVVNILVAVVGALLGYFLGGIPTGVVIGKVFFHKDPRDYYSKNSGGTNTGRVFGKKIGLLTIILDMIKCAGAVYIAWAVITFTPIHQYMWWGTYYAAPLWYWLVGLACSLGHCWPIYIGFKGGKAVSCFMGLNCFFSWVMFIGAGFTYLGVLFKTKTVSLASIITGIVSPVIAWVIAIVKWTTGFNVNIFTWMFGYEHALSLGWEFAVVVTVIGILIVVRHASNIQRLKAGTENKVKWIK